ncbi:MAG: DUF4177 domain-containing protein [Kofleriaceae bacterium]
MLQYKFIELSTVTEQTIEEAVNEWVGQGWDLEAIRFVTTEHSKRPAMAYVSFTRDTALLDGRGEAPRKPPQLVVDDGSDD